MFDGDVAMAWCEYGTPEELPNINHRKEYEAGLGRLPDYRITCLFVDKRYRHNGVTAVAIRGALGLIEQAGGGVVEAYPQDTPGKKVSATFLYNGTRSTFEQAGFSYDLKQPEEVDSGLGSRRRHQRRRRRGVERDLLEAPDKARIGRAADGGVVRHSGLLHDGLRLWPDGNMEWIVLVSWSQHHGM